MTLEAYFIQLNCDFCLCVSENGMLYEPFKTQLPLGWEVVAGTALEILGVSTLCPQSPLTVKSRRAGGNVGKGHHHPLPKGRDEAGVSCWGPASKCPGLSGVEASLSSGAPETYREKMAWHHSTAVMTSTADSVIRGSQGTQVPRAEPPTCSHTVSSWDFTAARLDLPAGTTKQTVTSSMEECGYFGAQAALIRGTLR